MTLKEETKRKKSTAKKKMGTSRPGRYQFKFFTDGVWFEGPLPDTEVITNPFGTQNFVKEVL